MSVKEKERIMGEIEDLKDKLASLELDKEKLEEQLEDYEVERSEDEYDDVLDEIYDEVSLGYSTFSPSQILRELDATAYRIGFNEWVDAFDKEDEDDYKIMVDELEYIILEIDDLLDEVDDLESELEDLEN